MHATFLDSSIATIPVNYNDMSRLNLNEDEEDFPVSPMDITITSTRDRTNSKAKKSILKPSSNSSNSLMIEEDKKETSAFPGSPGNSEDGKAEFLKRRRQSVLASKEQLASMASSEEISSPVKQEDEEKQEIEKLKPRRVSKYTQMVNHIADPDYEDKMRNLLKEYTNSGGTGVVDKKDQRLSLFHYSKNI